MNAITVYVHPSDCDSMLCTTWRVKSTYAASSEIDSQDKFISFFKVGVLQRVMWAGRRFARHGSRCESRQSKR